MPRSRRSVSLPLAVLAGAALLASAAGAAAPRAPRAAAPAFAPGLLAGLSLRSIGPAAMSGRVAAIAGSAADPDLLYVGAATGGLWKSTDRGVHFSPVFDDQTIAAIGAVAVFAGDPDVVWVGTGEANVRNSVSYGNGVYRSLDGGAHWQHVGLPASERIARIVLHPTDPDTAWVAALGPLWSDGRERGVYKTTDGGRSWRQVLPGDARTGCAELVADPRDPRRLYAAMWQFRRWPWFFRSGGPGSGLFVSSDGGETWTKRTREDGLPAGDLGRIGLAVAPSDPRIVYALVEAEKDNVLLRSEDGGRSFATVNSSSDVFQRPFYFWTLAVDPADPHRVYRPGFSLDVSNDSGRSFATLAGFDAVHPDHHALWIAPGDPRFLATGNDGGVAISDDGGRSWRFVSTLPLAQFYHVRTDDELPYNVYGGLQDNGSWKGPSAVWEGGGIRDAHWSEVGFGDGFDTAPDPRDAGRGWSMSQNGYLMRWDLRTGERRSVRPPPPASPAGSQSTPDPPGGQEPVKLRFNWNAGFALDPFAPGTIYLGSQFLHRSRDGGETWEVVSPDLTTNDPKRQLAATSGGLTRDASGAEQFTTIVAIAPSPVAQGTIWVGTDDGRLQLTRDGGATWTSLEKALPGVPAGTWIPHVVPSPHDAGTAFVVLDNHRRGDFAPYVLRTRDFGRSFESLVRPNLEGYALALAQDPVDPNLLFLGTERGLWVSVDGGGAWFRWQHGLPAGVSVMDLAIQKRDGDLVVATHGRGLYILDDLSPLRGLAAAALGERLHLFAPAPAQQHWQGQGSGGRFDAGAFQGENRPYGALVTFSLIGAELPYPDADVERARREKERAEANRQRLEGAYLEEDPAAATSAAPAQGEASASGVPPSGETAAGKPAAAVAAAGEKKAEGPGDEKPKAKLEIRDGAGVLLRTLEVPVHAGVNRVAWDLRKRAPRSPKDPDAKRDEGGEPAGAEVLPGRYAVTVSYGGERRTAPVEVVADPRFSIAPERRAAKWQALERAGALQERVVDALDHLADVRADLDRAAAKIQARQAAAKRAAAAVPAVAGADAVPPAKADDPDAGLLERIDAVREKLATAEKALRTPPKQKGLDDGEDTVLGKLGELQWLMASSWDAPTAAEGAALERVAAKADAALAGLDRVEREELAALREALGPGVGLLASPPSASPVAAP